MRLIPAERFAEGLGVVVLGQSAAWRIVIWSGALILVVLLAAVVLWFLRRKMMGPTGSVRGPLTLHDIRQMRERGEIDEDEYETLRRATLAEWGVGAGAAQETDKPRPGDSDAEG